MTSSAPAPTLTSLPFPPTPQGSPVPVVHWISNLLSASECSTIINSHTDLVPSNVTTGTKRDREVFDNEELAETLWERLKPFYAEDTVVDNEGSVWRVLDVNTKFRLCKYVPGGKFSPHEDGTRLASVNSCSFMTVNMYLNTVPLSSKGATRFLSQPSSSPDSSTSNVLAQVQPTLGCAAVFRDWLWHDGEELLEGEKYLLRTDVMYEREVPFDFEALYGGLTDEEKGRKALEIASRLEDAENSLGAVEWYKKAYRFCPELEK